MLSRADAQVASRDPAVPGLAWILDADAVADELRGALPLTAITAVRPTYVRYKPATSCVVGLRVTGDGIEVDAYAKAHRGDDADKVDKAVASATAPGPWGPGAVRLGHEIGVSFFPNDRSLRVAAAFSDPDRRRHLLAGMLPDRPDAWDGTLRTLRYKPERRYVARIDGRNGPAAVLRCYGREDFPRAKTAAHAFSSNGGVRVPALLGVSKASRVLAVEWLDARLPGPRPDGVRCTSEDFHAVGEALAWLHRQPAEGLPALERTREAALLGPAAEAVAGVMPDLAGDARTLAARLASALRALPAMHVPIHGDFSADQVVLDERGAAIIDFDSAALGDPASDLGLFAATLLVDVLQERLADAEGARRTRALVEGYGAAARAPGAAIARLDLYTAVWLLRLAVEPFRYRNPDWPDRIDDILRRASQQWTS